MSAVESELFNFFQCCRSIGSWKASPAGGLLVSKEYRRLSVAKIQKHYITERKAPTSYILSQMSKDKRRGVQKAYQSIQKRKKNKLREQHRLKQLLQIETELKEDGKRIVAGVDEAGVGSLAGPVVAASVIFKPGVKIIGIDDSKKLNAKTREMLSRKIQHYADAYAFGISEVAEIDRINVYQASLKAMQRSVLNLSVKPDHLLIDARELPDLKISQNAIVGGERRPFSIAAASILAKSFRDRLMNEFDLKYPGYGLARHKGYSTPEHQQAICHKGPCPIHRTSYSCIDELSGFYSKQFYQLKSQIQAVSCSEDLSLCKISLNHTKENLSNTENKKLHLMINRKLKRYPTTVQLNLLASA